MFHYLTLGHLNVDPGNYRKFVVTKPIDMDTVMRLLREIGNVDDQGQALLGGYPVRFREGYVSCPWLMPHKVPQTEAFARRLHEETGCQIFDIEHGARIEPDTLC